ncbi:myeloid leukemia factor isoform X1 [Plutella xylostella]|uniref:myeloid leukemia factor isoform X1 n=1 Tax=Plutella xylostella TaxID=51655 RepID=UPI002032591C|nr:myeloid leukemia factor isoform X1 [Plutella xylostella]
MSLFGSLMADVEDDPFFGSHMRHMRQMNNMMNSLFSDPFGMLGGMGMGMGGMGGGHLALTGHRHGGAMMPFMPQMPSLNRLFSADLEGGMSAGSSFSSSTVVMSNGPNGKPQVYSSTSSTKIGPGGVKETRATLQDSRTGTKKMSIGHHIGERAHVIEREQNVYSGDQEERQEFINLDEDEAEDFDREFQERAGPYTMSGRRRALSPAPRLALPAPPAEPTTLRVSESSRRPTSVSSAQSRSIDHRPSSVSSAESRSVSSESRRPEYRPSSRKPIRAIASPLIMPTTSASVREVYGSSIPQRHRHKHGRPHRHSPTE